MEYVIETLEAVDGKTQDLKELLAKIVPASRAESGILFYDLYQDLKKPNQFAVVMGFKDEAAYNAHINSPHILAIEKYENVIYKNVIENHYRKIE